MKMTVIWCADLWKCTDVSDVRIDSNIPESSHIHTHRHENLKSHTILTYSTLKMGQYNPSEGVIS
jgi:hypothetical protein